MRNAQEPLYETLQWGAEEGSNRVQGGAKGSRLMKWALRASRQAPGPGAGRECSQARFASSEQVQVGRGGPRVGRP